MSRIEYLSNPATWWTSGSRQESFTYEGGKELYHFTCVKLPGFSSHVFINTVFFANSEQHAAEVLERMLGAHLKSYTDSTNEEVKQHLEARLKFVQGVLDNKHLWKFSVAPRNQFYRVGWAVNDTFL